MPAPKRVLETGADQDARKRKKSNASAQTLRPVNLKAEEEFQRGGGFSLTPLEKRQIEAKAKRDVLFEQQSSKGRKVDHEFSSGDEEAKDGQGPPARKQRKLAEHTKRAPEKPVTGDEADKARGLAFKRLTPGSLVLGRIADITYKGLALSLPNNLTGYVQLSSILNGLSVLDEEADAAEVLSLLTKLFEKGQFLRACVVLAGDPDSEDKSKRRIELSVEPQEVNKGLQPTDLVRHSMVQVEVTSIEDHGLVVDLGVDKSQISGFIPTKELDGKDAEIFVVGSVLLCYVTETPKNTKVVKLSIDEKKIWNVGKSNFLKDAPNIDLLSPGVAIEFTVSKVTPAGLLGRAMGIAKVTVDMVHSAAWLNQKSMPDMFPVGSKLKGRVIWKLSENDEPMIGISLMDHLMQGKKAISSLALSENLVPDTGVSTIVDNARIIEVQPSFGLFLDLGPAQPRAFVHISRVSDEKIQQLSGSSGPFAVDSRHRCRIVGFNTVDMLFLASMEQSVLDLPFLRLEDLRVGQLVKGSVDDFVHGRDEVVGLVVKLTESISGLAAKLHLSDVTLEHPEKKFKPKSSVNCRVLSIDSIQRRLKLTLKRSLVNSDAPVWQSFTDVELGVQVPGTLISFVPGGAIIQFFGDLRGYLPVSQMSEAYLTDPRDAFRLGQVISVQALSVDRDAERLVLTCRDQGGLTSEQLLAFTELSIGSAVEGSVIEKSKDDLILRLTDYGVKARLAYDHLIDGSAKSIATVSKRTRIGQTLKDLVVLQKDPDRNSLRLTSKPSLRKAFALNKVPFELEQLHVGMQVTGYINNVTASGVFVSFGGTLTALLPKSCLGQEALEHSSLTRNTTIDCQVANVDLRSGRALLAPKDEALQAHAEAAKDKQLKPPGASNEKKQQSEHSESYTIGQLVQATIASKKDTQLNVDLPGGQQGRIDVSEVFNNWKDIKDRKHPLRQFHLRQEVSVRVLGIHDSRNHRFLPITHSGKAPVFELSLKSAGEESADDLMLSLDKIQLGSKWICFVNNIKDSSIWVNLSPNVRGRIDALNLTDDIRLLGDLKKNFPVGSAIRATVSHVDSSTNRLDLIATTEATQLPTSIEELSIGAILPAKITKVMDKSVIVQLSDTISAPLGLTDLEDDFSAVYLSSYHKDQMLRVRVKSIDLEKKRVGLSARPSNTEDSSPLPIDKDLTDVSQVHVNDLLHGFVKSVSKNGIFVSLASGIDAFVHVRDISDSYIKNWESKHKPNDLVRGKVIAVEPELGRIQMSLKDSVLDPNYTPPITYNDVKVGDILPGKVRKVEEFGAFIVLDSSANVSGLCHRSQMANEPISNAKDILQEGDPVTVAVLKIDSIFKKISLSLKSSHVSKGPKEDLAVSRSVHDSEPESSDDGEPADQTGSADHAADTAASHLVGKSKDDTVQHFTELLSTMPGLVAGSFDWSGNAAAASADTGFESDSGAGVEASGRSKRKKSEIKVDRTAELDVNGPQSVADFERLLLGQPNSSYLWVSYMAHQLQHGETDKARAVAERAVRTINHQSQDSAVDALNAWVAYLNLENAHGDEDAVDKVFKRACEVNDPQEMHGRLASIYIQSGNLAKADDLLNKMVKSFSQDPKVWLNYATFLFDSAKAPGRVRDLLERALQTLPKTDQVEVTSKFAQLEYRSEHGEPERGRTLFEGLSASFPKRLDLWDVRLDQEMKLGDYDQVRRIFARVTSGELKPKKAKHFFKRWLDFEKANGQPQDVSKVEARAAEYVKIREGIGAAA